jgi:hypothetical protein
VSQLNFFGKWAFFDAALAAAPQMRQAKTFMMQAAVGTKNQ